MANPITSFVNYVRSAKTELEKVSWPSRQETIRYSALVCVVCIVTAAFFAALDFGLGFGVDQLISLRNAPAAPAEAPSQPVVPDLSPSIEAVDAETGLPTNVDIQTIPLEGGNGSFNVTE